MKVYLKIALSLLLLFISELSIGQDKIIEKSGKVWFVEIQEIDGDFIQFVQHNADSITFALSRRLIDSVYFTSPIWQQQYISTQKAQIQTDGNDFIVNRSEFKKFTELQTYMEKDAVALEYYNKSIKNRRVARSFLTTAMTTFGLGLMVSLGDYNNSLGGASLATSILLFPVGWVSGARYYLNRQRALDAYGIDYILYDEASPISFHIGSSENGLGLVLQF